MKNYFTIAVFFHLFFFSIQMLAQGPGQPFHPVVANGAKNIYKTDQQLRWENPVGTTYNEVYVSTNLNLVINLDPSVKLLDGSPGTIFTSAALGPIEPLQYEVKYYWRVVEHNNTNYTAGPVWYFQTLRNLSEATIFEDNFDDYTPGLQLSCQNPNDWITWNNLPCDPIEDPLVSNLYSYSDSNSFHIIEGNDVLKNIGPFTIGYYKISFMMYIPDGYTGYWNVLQQFNPAYWGFEVYWNVNGTGTINAGGNDAAQFSFVHDSWFETSLTIDLDNDLAEFNINGFSIYSWQWSLGASGTGGLNQLNAVDFYGHEPACNYYVDNFKIYAGIILSPPIPPRDIQAYVANETAPKVILQWLPGNWYPDTGYAVYRKPGLPLEPGNYELISDALNSNTFTYTDTTVSALQVYTYMIQLLSAGPEPFSAEATAYVPGITPVELTSFIADIQNQNVFLIWTTSTETNNKGFEVQKLQNYNNEKLQDWKELGFVDGNGTTTLPNQYSYADENVVSGKYKYRLKQIDFDGSYKYSNEIEVNLNSTLEFSLEQNYPNPFNPVTTIRYSIPNVISIPTGRERNLVTLKIYNVLGEEVANLVNEQKPAGKYEVKLNGSNLPSGVYIYRLTAVPIGRQAGSYSASKKLILLK